MRPPDLEIVDAANGVVIRRIVVPRRRHRCGRMRSATSTSTVTSVQFTATAQLLGCGCRLGPTDNDALWNGESRPITGGETIRCGSTALRAISTPGHTPGSICLTLGSHLFSGDTLFPGGPGLTGSPLSDFDTIIASITTNLFSLAEETIVHPGHGLDTTIGTERPSLPSWIERGW